MTDSINCLAIDIGNTSISFGYFSANQLIKTKRYATENFSMPPIETVHRIFISSVVPKMDALFQLLLPTPVFITYANIPELCIDLLHPEEAGADRIVNAFGAWKRWNSAIILIDCGTATTICLVSQKGVYEGGAILPGIPMAFKALHQFTAKLPMIQPNNELVLPLGKSTREAMLAGQYWGHIGAIKELIFHYRQKEPLAKIIATGGNLSWLCTELSFIDEIDDLLILKSLNLVQSYFS